MNYVTLWHGLPGVEQRGGWSEVLSWMGEKDRRTFSLDPMVSEELEDLGNASKVVNDLLTEYFRGGRDGSIALEVKLQETERRLNEAMDDRDSINRRIERLRDQKQRIEDQMNQRRAERQEKLREAAPIVAGKELDNPAVENWAEKLGMAPHDLLREVEQIETDDHQTPTA